MHSKNSINVISVDVNVTPRYLKPLMHVHKDLIINLDDLNAGKKHCIIKTGHCDFRFFFSSVIMPNVMGAILL